MDRSNDEGLRDALGVYLVAMTRAQRSQRLARTKNMLELQQELANMGHTNWIPRKYPQWLGLEFENNIMIRPLQVDVALSMLADFNCVMQLNMGEGKTKVHNLLLSFGRKFLDCGAHVDSYSG